MNIPNAYSRHHRSHVLYFGLTLTFGAAQASEHVYQLDADIQLQGVNHLETSVPSAFSGANVADLIGADRFHANGITGQGTTAANIEAGHVWSGHESLGQVSSFVHNSALAWNDPQAASQTEGLFDRHATWVGMTIGGRQGGSAPGEHQEGIAPGTDLRSGAIATSWSGSAYSLSFGASAFSILTPFATYFGADDPAQAVDVVNSSFGFTDPGGSSVFSWLFDGLVAGSPETTFVASAGNLGAANSGGSPGAGYNAITVGALQNDGANGYDAVASFSSRGPHDYVDPDNGTISGVRALVDISAPGTNLLSARYNGQTGGNNSTLAGSPNPNPASNADNLYSTVAGTSFSSPITAGAVALLNSASYNTPELAGNGRSRDTRVVKAVLQNSADKITGWSNALADDGNGVLTTTQSLDWASGAGALNLDRSWDQYIAADTRDLDGLGGGYVDGLGWDYGEIALGQTHSYDIRRRVAAGDIITVTLDWLRDRAFDFDTLDISDNRQADLNLGIRDAVSGTLVAQSVSLYNLVEHLQFQAPTTSAYQIEVSYLGDTFNAGDLQSTVGYGLAWNVPASIAIPPTLPLLAVGVLLLSRRGRRPELNRSLS